MGDTKIKSTNFRYNGIEISLNLHIYPNPLERFHAIKNMINLKLEEKYIRPIHLLLHKDLNMSNTAFINDKSEFIDVKDLHKYEIIIICHAMHQTCYDDDNLFKTKK